MSLTSTNALVSIAVAGGVAVPQAPNAVLAAAAGNTLTFSLQSTALVQRWEVNIASDFPTLNGQNLTWVAGMGNQLFLPTPTAPYSLTYQSLVSDGSSSTAFVSGKVTSVGIGALPVVTTLNFLQPTVNATVNAAVANSSAFVVNEYVNVATGGLYLVTAVPDVSHLTIQNTGAAGNASPGATIPALSLVLATGAPGTPGTAGPPGSGTSIAAAPANVTANTTLSNGSLVRYNIDAGQASQIILTFGASPTAGDSYLLKSVNNPASGNPVLIRDPVHNIEDPNNPQTYGHGPYSLDFQGMFVWYQYNGNTTQWDRLVFR
jgi:hypothetical protein